MYSDPEIEDALVLASGVNAVGEKHGAGLSVTFKPDGGSCKAKVAHSASASESTASAGALATGGVPACQVMSCRRHGFS